LLEHEITKQGREMFQNEGSKSQFSITEAQEEHEGSLPKIVEHEKPGKRIFMDEGDGNGERSSEYARVLHEMETGESSRRATQRDATQLNRTPF